MKIRAIAGFMLIAFGGAAVLAVFVLIWQHIAWLYLLFFIAAAWYVAVKWGDQRIF